MNLGFLGTGHIASSVIEGIFKSKIKIKNIYISPRNSILAKKLSKRFKKISISKNNQQLIDDSNWIFLSITPKVGHKILKNLKFKNNKRIVSFISTINSKVLKKYTKNKNVSRVIPLPFIGIKKGPIIISPSNKRLNDFFSHLGNVFELNERLSKAFWSTSSFMASFYYLLFSTSNWLVSKGIKRNKAESYTRELFLALTLDAINKKKIPLKKLVLESQTPGGTNEFVLKKLKKTKFYNIQQKVLNSIFKKF